MTTSFIIISDIEISSFTGICPCLTPCPDIKQAFNTVYGGFWSGTQHRFYPMSTLINGDDYDDHDDDHDKPMYILAQNHVVESHIWNQTQSNCNGP